MYRTLLKGTSSSTMAILLRTLFTFGACWSAGTANAGALYFYEMSNASESSYGGAGMTARANDAGTVFTNPAGMALFDDSAMLACIFFNSAQPGIDLAQIDLLSALPLDIRGKR